MVQYDIMSMEGLDGLIRLLWPPGTSQVPFDLRGNIDETILFGRGRISTAALEIVGRWERIPVYIILSFYNFGMFRS